MTRPRRQQAIPNLVLVTCTGRGEHQPARLAALLGTMQDGNLRFSWVPRGKGGKSPVTGRRRGPEGWHTITVRCGTCGRNPQVREERFGTIVQALAADQETSGERPVTVDISRLDAVL